MKGLLLLIHWLWLNSKNYSMHRPCITYNFQWFYFINLWMVQTFVAMFIKYFHIILSLWFYKPNTFYHIWKPGGNNLFNNFGISNSLRKPCLRHGKTNWLLTEKNRVNVITTSATRRYSFFHDDVHQDDQKTCSKVSRLCQIDQPFHVWTKEEISFELWLTHGKRQ